ncbi:MAG TPA: PDZ domain-containing protein [Gemmatimonadales bacterium]|nr:PDZ domain-containing protein [Gemmatimonadales bacterium]
MQYRWIPLAIAGLLAAAPLAAQQDSGKSREKRESRLLVRTVPGGTWVASMTHRGRLGVIVNMQPRSSDSLGAYIEAVTPGGPADNAGIRSGDVITRLDGKSLLEGGKGDGEQSAPGVRLVELAAKLEPHDTVKVEYRRDGKTRTVTLVTDQDPWFVVSDARPGAEIRAFESPTWDPARVKGLTVQGDRLRLSLLNSPLSDLELAPLNSDLGAYFGTTDGVLVISVPDSSKLGLKAGDVILSVDGRKPTSPAHLMRILRSYNSDEHFKLDVLRSHHRQTITGQLDGR